MTNPPLPLSSPQEREAALFALALEKAPGERPALLAAVCGTDTALRQRLEILLAAHDEGNPALDAGPEAGPAPAPAVKATVKLEFAEAPDATIGQVIGRYKVLQKIGEGGCGAVYMAEQEQPVRRRVALKVIKLGMDTKAVIARFEAERQALALMDHPNIAKVLDAGATDTGRPYFVMELVRGIRITDYCDQNKLPTRERLELFIKICQAIQHAHQKGIIHRDIKPSNILVTLHDGVPVPKVIDFGIAKATTDQRLTDKTLFTAYEQFIGTPAYMSPEQAEMSGLDIDTRSDIYSLGVLLYELLTGRTPFDARELMESGIDAMRKTIREKDPVRPSTKVATLQGEDLTTTAQRRSADRAKLLHQLKGDLDWIVMKCLEKDRTRRYETANGLAMELKRHLNNETVTARPPSRLYEFQKMFRRHKVGFAAAAAVIIALTAGVLASSWQAVVAMSAKRNAQAAEGRAVKAQADEVTLRVKAQADELAARQRAYASDMNVASQALENDDLGRALDLLSRQRPPAGQKDLRGWEWRYLRGQARSDSSFTLCQEPGEINSLAVSGDSLSLAVGSYHRGGLTVWDLRARKEVARLGEGEVSVKAAFSSTEPLLAFAGTDSSGPREGKPVLRLWNTATRQSIADIPLEDERCDGLAFARDGRTLVTSTERLLGNGHITLWRSDGTKVVSYKSDVSSVMPATAFAVTPDLDLAAHSFGAASQGQIRAFDLRDGRTLWTAQAARVVVTALAFSPDGKTLASGAGWNESDIRLWDVASGREIGRLQGHHSWVSSIAFSPDGKSLLSSSADQTIRVWNVSTHQCINVLRGHRQEVWRVSYLPDGKTLVSGGKDGTVCFWDTSAPHRPPSSVTNSDDILTWRFEPDGRSILLLNRRGEVKRLSAPAFSQSEPLLNVGEMASAPVSFCCFSPDARFLAVGGKKGLQWWDIAGGTRLHQWTNVIGRAEDILPDNKHVILAWADSGLTFREWAVGTGAEVQSWQMPGGVHALGISPDERSCVSLNYEGDVVLRDLEGQRSESLKLDVVEPSGAAYSPDGRLLAVGSDLGFAQIWNVQTWRQVAKVGFLSAANTVRFSPDGRRLAVGAGGNHAVTLFDTDSWQSLLTLSAEGNDFDALEFSSDGNTIGWLNEHGTLHLWRAPSWAEINAAEAEDKSEPQRF